MRAGRVPAHDSTIFLVLTDRVMPLRAVLTFDARCKSRLLLRLDNGEQAALIVERGKVLRDGERVRIEDGREVEIVAAEESLLEAGGGDPLPIAQGADHLGYPHL